MVEMGYGTNGLFEVFPHIAARAHLVRSTIAEWRITVFISLAR